MESFSYLSSQTDKMTFTWASRTREALGHMMSGLDTHDITNHSRLGLVTCEVFARFYLQFVLVNYMLEFQM